MKYGDKIKVITEKEEICGFLMPSSEALEGITMIKLESGYNIGIENKKIKKIEIIEEYKETKKKPKEISRKKELKTISILHTGGTIASKVDYRTGGVIARFTPEELIEMFPEIKDIANIKSRLIRNMWSEDIRFGHYNLLAKEIEKEIKQGADGIIITHGTDTMHVTSAALSFILEGLPVPVILVGAQRSSDRGSSDAAINLLSASYFIVNSDFAEVAICMHESMDDEKCVILPGTKTRKMHTSRRDAFRPINSTAKAIVNFEKKEIKFLQRYKKRSNVEKLNLKLINDSLKIGLLKLHNNMFADQFLFYKDYDGLLIEGFALGQIPVNEIDVLTKKNAEIKKVLKEVASKIPVAFASQCIYGRVNMNVYQTGRDVQALGIIGNLTDMTPETGFIKLAWLLSNHKDKVRELYSKNLRGEITYRTEAHEFLN